MARRDKRREHPKGDWPKADGGAIFRSIEQGVREDVLAVMYETGARRSELAAIVTMHRGRATAEVFVASRATMAKRALAIMRESNASQAAIAGDRVTNPITA